MDPQDAIDLGREALWLTFVVSSPALVVGMLVGLAVGLLQALTQIQEHTVAFVAKTLAMAAVLAITLPWLLGKLVDYSSELFHSIPGRL